MIIRKLPEAVVQQIAAGEVVESPASVVKELVENSIDAGATAITVELLGGGSALIRVTDNGSGMEKEDAVQAFSRHATSKIREEQDLYNLHTLGFRGEALYAIAAVSKTELLTRTAEAKAGCQVLLAAGEIQAVAEAACPEGTTICVRDLFYNTPARQKFLKKPQYENAKAADVVVRLMLANPGVAMRLLIERKTLYRSGGNGSLSEVLCSIYGRELSPYLYPVEYEDAQTAIRIRGAVVGAQMTKGNRSAQTFFVNERYIHSKQLSAALESAYGVSLMQHRFPIAALDIDIPPNSVDINISPNKLRARFHHERAVLQAVRQGAMQALRDGSPGVFDVPAPASPAPKARIVLSDADAQTAGTRTADAATIEKAPAAKAVAAPMQAPPEAGGRPIEASAGTLRAHAGVLDVSGRAAGLPLGGYPNEARPASARDLSSDRPQGVGDASAKNSSSASAGPEGGARPKPLQQQMRAPEEAQLPAYRILGQLHNTYVVLEVEDGMLLIDQHAAHERMKYDALMEQAERGGVAEQQLLIPARLKLTPQEYTRMQSLLESLNALGFRARLCDDYTLEVDTLPMVLGHPDAQDLLTVLREDLYAIEKSAQMRTQQIAKMACKAAVRGGDRLSAMELQQLLRRLARSEYHLTCPHGRPIAVSFSKRDLEKLFKRIV